MQSTVGSPPRGRAEGPPVPQGRQDRVYGVRRATKWRGDVLARHQLESAPAALVSHQRGEQLARVQRVTPVGGGCEHAHPRRLARKVVPGCHLVSVWPGETTVLRPAASMI